MTSVHSLTAGPSGHFILGSLPGLKSDPIGYLRECERLFGSVVRLRMPWPIRELHVVTDPALAERIFLTDAQHFRRSRLTQRMASPVLGNGLLLAEDDAWRRQRRLVQPAFHHAQVASYVECMAIHAEALAEAWSDGRERDVYADTLDYAISVAARTMFGAAVGQETERVRNALNEALSAFDRYKTSRLPLPLSIPTPTGRRLQRASREIETLVYRALAQRRATGARPVDLLSMLLHARDESGAGLTDRQIRDEAITAFAGGTEPSAICLAWTFYLLARHPDIAARVTEEVDRVVRQNRIQSDHVRQLRYTESVVRECLRIYPPIWRISREARTDVVLDGLTLRRGSQVVVSPYLIHQHPRYFPEPSRFEPDRWTDSLVQSLPKFAYFPFGSGQRRCVGYAFAMTELVVCVATIASRVRFELTDRIPTAKAGSMLRPRDGVQLRTHRA